MTEIRIETLKEELGEYLTRVRQGERIVFTDQGRSVAVLVSLDASSEVRKAWKLVETGAAHWQGGKPSGFRNRPKLSGSRASDVVLEDRR
jgi:prevent-host-death family protein